MLNINLNSNKNFILLQPVFVLSVDSPEPTFLEDLQQAAVVGDMVVVLQNQGSKIQSEISCYSRGVGGLDGNIVVVIIIIIVILLLLLLLLLLLSLSSSS